MLQYNYVSPAQLRKFRLAVNNKQCTQGDEAPVGGIEEPAVVEGSGSGGGSRRSMREKVLQAVAAGPAAVPDLSRMAVVEELPGNWFRLQDREQIRVERSLLDTAEDGNSTESNSASCK